MSHGEREHSALWGVIWINRAALWQRPQCAKWALFPEICPQRVEAWFLPCAGQGLTDCSDSGAPAEPSGGTGRTYSLPAQWEKNKADKGEVTDLFWPSIVEWSVPTASLRGTKVELGRSFSQNRRPSHVNTQKTEDPCPNQNVLALKYIFAHLLGHFVAFTFLLSGQCHLRPPQAWSIPCPADISRGSAELARRASCCQHIQQPKQVEQKDKWAQRGQILPRQVPVVLEAVQGGVYLCLRMLL